MWPGTQVRALNNKCWSPWREQPGSMAEPFSSCIDQTQEQGQKVPEGQDYTFLSCPKAPSEVLGQHLLTEFSPILTKLPQSTLNSRMFLFPFPITFHQGLPHQHPLSHTQSFVLSHCPKPGRLSGQTQGNVSSILAHPQEKGGTILVCRRSSNDSKVFANTAG